MWMLVAAGVLAILAIGSGGARGPDPGPRRRGDAAGSDVALSEHFTLSELSKTGHADLRDTNFEQAHEHVESLVRLALLLEQVRALLGDLPLSIHDAYRCPELNARDDGAEDSQHLVGEAADFHVNGMGLEEAFDRIRRSNLRWGQLILEARKGRAPTWIHISLPRRGRNQMVGTFDGNTYRWSA